MRAFALVFTVLLLATRTYAHDEDSFEAEGSLG